MPSYTYSLGGGVHRGNRTLSITRKGNHAIERNHLTQTLDRLNGERRHCVGVGKFTCGNLADVTNSDGERQCEQCYLVWFQRKTFRFVNVEPW